MSVDDFQVLSSDCVSGPSVGDGNGFKFQIISSLSEFPEARQLCKDVGELGVTSHRYILPLKWKA